MTNSINRNRFASAFLKNGRGKSKSAPSSRKISNALEDQQSGVEVSYLDAAISPAEEDPYETLCCLKWGAHYGLISESAYESGKAELLARL